MSLQASVYTLISSISSVPVIFANQNGPQPAAPFITIGLMGGNAQDVHIGATSAEGVRTLDAHRTTTVSLRCFGAGCFDMLDALALKLETEAALVLADSLNLAVVGKEALQYAPQLIDGTAWEPVAVLDVFVASTSRAIEDVGYIATVEVGGSTDGKEIEQQVIAP